MFALNLIFLPCSLFAAWLVSYIALAKYTLLNNFQVNDKVVNLLALGMLVSFVVGLLIVVL